MSPLHKNQPLPSDGVGDGQRKITITDVATFGHSSTPPNESGRNNDYVGSSTRLLGQNSHPKYRHSNACHSKSPLLHHTVLIFYLKNRGSLDTGLLTSLVDYLCVFFTCVCTNYIV